MHGCFIFSLVKYKPLTYNKVYEYPDWSIGVGWTLALSSMICIPMVVVIKIIQSDGPLIERIKAVAAPVRGGASSSPQEYRPKNTELAHPLDPNGNNGLMKPSHTIVETMILCMCVRLCVTPNTHMEHCHGYEKREKRGNNIRLRASELCPGLGKLQCMKEREKERE
ncbi:hypothetical protein NFI96_003789 [Prochilodus magdalenae]|nr:hypothetical protein NFI96_003789 [Prochilodus magdalenae]